MFRRMVATACLLSVVGCASAVADGGGMALLRFDEAFDVKAVKANGATVSRAKGGRLRIETARGGKHRWPGVDLKAPRGKWDLSTYRTVQVDVRNVGKTAARVHCRVDNPGANGARNCANGRVEVAPGATETIFVTLSATPWRFDRPLELIGMRGTPGQAPPLDPTNVTQLVIFVTQPKTDHAFEIGNIRATGRVETLSAATFLPFIDEFGQYIHADWPGKTHSLKDFQTHKAAEQRDLADHPGPLGRSEYGGWAAGPQLEATGFFRTQKHQGKWWLVDPTGRLFWSNGIDCVHGNAATTPITDRKDYYRSLPAPPSPFAQFFGRGRWAPHGYYQGRKYETYNFTSANLLRKYGEGWRDAHIAITHRRLRSWGLNTIANWSAPEYRLKRTTPYVVSINYGGPSIQGSKGFWKQFADVFDPRSRATLAKSMAKEANTSAGDPWCLGYFVDNELSWGTDTSLAEGMLASPAEQAGKKVFVADLKAKYGSVDKLNKVWGTSHASWEALLQSQTPPDRTKAGADLRAFYAKIADTYFRICREEVKRVAPKNLYLGCRFSSKNDLAVQVGAKYCDVVSYNWYRYTAADVTLPSGLDKPMVIGEFHFGALDRGMFHTGLRATTDQNDRAAKYKAYVRSALRNPLLVGVHWFQYSDQATTGRGDGENYQIGFTDVCDTPYPETVTAAREVGYGMYEVRAKE